jgi:hypothetical protein
MPATREVFGSRTASNPLSYVVRNIEQQFKDALANERFAAIVIYGTSKQGKSSLRRSVLPDGACTIVRATLGVSREGLFREILNQAGAAGRTTRGVDKRTERNKGFSFNPLKWFGIEGIGEISIREKNEHKESEMVDEVEIDYSVTSAVARRYRQVAGTRPIVIDNFHYVEADVQRQLATDILAFADCEIKTIVLGTWTAQDYLKRFNTDLGRRMCPLSIEPWVDADLGAVLATGAKLLAIRLTPIVKESFLQKSAGNVSLLQDAAQEYLINLGIAETCSQQTLVDDTRSLREVYRKIAAELAADTTERFQQIAKIGEPWINNKTRMYWIIKAFLRDQQSTNVAGVLLDRLITSANALLQLETLTQEKITKPIASLLVKHTLLSEQQKQFRTPIIAFDEERDRLFTVDSWTLFTLRRHREEIANAL